MKELSVLKVILHITVTLALAIGFISSASAQKQSDKTLLQQLEDEENNEKQKKLHKGQEQPASKSLQRARDNAQSNATSCPKGTRTRNIEDVRAYLIRQDEILQKFAASIERFTTKAIEKNSAIDEFNKLVSESNDIVVWGRGKVTDGVCGSINQTEIIGKAIGATSILIEDYRRALQ